jgi:adenylate cyclase
VAVASGAAESRASLRDGDGGAGDVWVVQADPGFVLHELSLLRLRALLARAQHDETGYLKYAKDYGALANSLGFEAHMAQARAMSSWPAINVT